MSGGVFDSDAIDKSIAEILFTRDNIVNHNDIIVNQCLMILPSEYLDYILLYPLDKVEVIDDTLIGVESMLDAILLRKWGYRNAVAMMGDGMSVAQADQIASRCSKFIDLFDNDKGGQIARKVAKKRLGDRVLYLTPHYYPETGKDPSEWGEEETNAVIESAGLVSHKLPRL